MRPGLRRLAGSPSGQYGYNEGPATDATFNNPLDIVVTPDGTTLYIADYGNQSIRTLDLTTLTVSTFANVSCRPKHLALSPDGNRLLLTGDSLTTGASVLLEFPDISSGPGTESWTTSAGALGAIAYHRDGQSAVVRARTNLGNTGWHSLALTGPERGTLTEPPTIPDPPFCDPPTNSIPVTVVYSRDGDGGGDAGVSYVGSVVVGYHTSYRGLVAFDPWPPATPTFPGPYVTCGPAEAPAAVYKLLRGAEAPSDGYYNLPVQLTTGPFSAGLPTLLAPLWLSSKGIVQTVQVDVTNPTNPFLTHFDRSSGITNRPITGIAYSTVEDRTFLTTAGSLNNWNYPGQSNGTPYNQILELAMVSDPPVFFGGSGVMPIGHFVDPEVPIGIVTEDGDLLVDENGDTLIFG